jgi:hypothetical protein
MNPRVYFIEPRTVVGLFYFFNGTIFSLKLYSIGINFKNQ